MPLPPLGKTAFPIPDIQRPPTGTSNPYDDAVQRIIKTAETNADKPRERAPDAPLPSPFVTEKGDK